MQVESAFVAVGCVAAYGLAFGKVLPADSSHKSNVRRRE